MTTLDVIIAILIIAWLGGFTFHFAGELIHLLLVIAIVIFIIRVLG